MSSENSNSNNIGHGPSTVLSMPDDVESLKARILEVMAETAAAMAEVERLKRFKARVETVEAAYENLEAAHATVKARLETAEEDKEDLSSFCQHLLERQAELEAELEARAEAAAPAPAPAPEETDEEEEDDTVAQALEHKTLKSERILPDAFFPLKDAVEDTLFEAVDLRTDTVMKLLLTDPLNSHLLAMDVKGYGATIRHLMTYLRDTKIEMHRSASDLNILTVSIQHASNDLVYWNQEVGRLKQQTKESEQKADLCDERYKMLEARKEELDDNIHCMEKNMKVAFALMKSIELLSAYHQNKEHQKTFLPLGKVESELDKNFITFKEKCKLTDYDSATKLKRQQLSAINRAATMLGLANSPYFKNNGFDPLRIGHSTPGSKLLEEICKVFRIPIPAYKSPQRKRKNSSSLDPASYGEHAKRRAVQEIFNRSPQLNRSLVSASGSKKKRALPKSSDGN